MEFILLHVHTYMKFHRTSTPDSPDKRSNYGNRRLFWTRAVQNRRRLVSSEDSLWIRLRSMGRRRCRHKIGSQLAQSFYAVT